MIAFLRGQVKTLSSDTVVLDVGGVGYEVCVSRQTKAQIPTSGSVGLEIYTHVREDVLKLYGFFHAMEKKMFLAFISINGVGPKMALSILSSMSSLQEVIEMIENEDISGLSRLPRVGRKIAQQMVLSLKGHLPQTATSSGEPSVIQTREWLYSALINLGFRAGEVRMVLDQISIGQDRQAVLKKALSCLQPRQ